MKKYIYILVILTFISCSTKRKSVMQQDCKSRANSFSHGLQENGVDSIFYFEIISGCVVPERTEQVYVFWAFKGNNFARKFGFFGDTDSIKTTKFMNEGILLYLDSNFNNELVSNPPYPIGCRIDFCSIYLSNTKINFKRYAQEQYLNPNENGVMLIDKIRSHILSVFYQY